MQHAIFGIRCDVLRIVEQESSPGPLFPSAPWFPSQAPSDRYHHGSTLPAFEFHKSGIRQ